MNSCESTPHLFSKKKLLIFDFDGTLADTSLLHAQAFSEILAPQGVKVDYSKIAGRKTSDALLFCYSDAGLPEPDAQTLAVLIAEKQQRVRKYIATGLSPLPGVDEFLRWAKPRFKIALVTSGSSGTVDLALKKLGYMGWFDPILYAHDVKVAKPSPEGFLRVLKLTSTTSDEALVFEDSQVGFKSAIAANIDFIDARNLDWSLMKEFFL